MEDIDEQPTKLVKFHRLGDNTPVIAPKPIFKYGSLSHKVLAYARMVNKAFTAEEVKNYFGSPLGVSDIMRSLKVLQNNKSVSQLNEKYWTITSIGKVHVSVMAEQKPL